MDLAMEDITANRLARNGILIVKDNLKADAGP